MSLINDALNRARAEAARREAEARGESPALLARVPRRSFAPPAGLWLALGALALAAALWFAAPRPEPGGHPSAGNVVGDGAPAPQDGAPVPEIEAPAPEIEASPFEGEALIPSPRDEPAPDEGTRDEPAPPGTTARTIPPAPPARTEPAPAAAPAAHDTQAPVAVWPADGGQDETWYYVGSFVVPGGGAIELGGIAWSAAAPSAMINGSLLSVGDEILGLTVAEIDPRTVILTGRGQRVALQLGGSSQP